MKKRAPSERLSIQTALLGCFKQSYQGLFGLLVSLPEPVLVPPAEEAPPAAELVVIPLEGAFRVPEETSLLSVVGLEPLLGVSPVLVAAPCSRLQATIANAAQTMKINFFIADMFGVFSISHYFSFVPYSNRPDCRNNPVKPRFPTGKAP
jgi:hypothetical protein